MIIWCVVPIGIERVLYSCLKKCNGARNGQPAAKNDVYLHGSCSKMGYSSFGMTTTCSTYDSKCRPLSSPNVSLTLTIWFASMTHCKFMDIWHQFIEKTIIFISVRAEWLDGLTLFTELIRQFKWRNSHVADIWVPGNGYNIGSRWTGSFPLKNLRRS